MCSLVFCTKSLIIMVSMINEWLEPAGHFNYHNPNKTNNHFLLLENQTPYKADVIFKIL